MDALHVSNGVITGSSAHTMLMGGDTVQGSDLNIIVPHHHFQDMHAFIVHTLGYKNVSSIPHPAMRAVVAHFGKYKSNHNIITISSGQRGASILHIILNAPTSADMLFMTTGGLTCFYPQWMQQHVAIQTHTGDRVLPNHKLGSVGELLDDILVADGTDFIGEPCGNRCPALWHRIEDKSLRLSVDWDMDDSVTNIFHNVDIEWRLNTHCTNRACPYNVVAMSTNCESDGAINRADVKYMPREIQCRKPHFKQTFTALFYGVACHRPFLVPVPVWDGVDQEPTLDDLYVTYWVSQHDIGACTASRHHLRHTFTTVPDINLTLENTYTVFLERPQESAVRNNVLVWMASMSGDHDSVGVKGSVLIVKQAVSGASEWILYVTRSC
ncbi:hypothetical protein CY34DRAFT_15193 [Suillus luteus UH-Slu-Lm8-n1]|uniref:Uncharacterized protein n=1 Tax=Suillus luteus UH-Slu-Lm8-n1 TaxID=930992 RepID=A0A0D0AV09_9AGAM|nr:hypothetical protein CY34DRAFT_15193 [Suillus luteus UH-Slu-Lm8-n1]